MASLKCSWAATGISSRSRWSLSGVSFQLTMKPRDARRLGLLDLVAHHPRVAARIGSDQRQVFLGPCPGVMAEPDVVVSEQRDRGRGALSRGRRRSLAAAVARPAALRPPRPSAQAAGGQRSRTAPRHRPAAHGCLSSPGLLSWPRAAPQRRAGCRRRARTRRRRVRDSSGTPAIATARSRRRRSRCRSGSPRPGSPSGRGTGAPSPRIRSRSRLDLDLVVPERKIADGRGVPRPEQRPAGPSGPAWSAARSCRPPRRSIASCAVMVSA